MNEKEEAAKIGEMVKQRQSLKKRLATLENEFGNMSREWKMLADIYGGRSFREERYVIEKDEIKIMRPKRYMGLQEREYEEGSIVALEAFDRDAIVELLTDLTNTRNDLQAVVEQLRPFEIPD